MQETSVSSTGDGAEAFVKGEVARPSLELFDFRGKRVLEIGAGQGVAGFLAALGAGTTSERKGSQVDLRAKSIVITDGNSQVCSVGNSSDALPIVYFVKGRPHSERKRRCCPRPRADAVHDGVARGRVEVG